MFHAELSIPQLTTLVRANVLHPHGARNTVCIQVATDKERQAIDDLFSKTNTPALSWITLKDIE